MSAADGNGAAPSAVVPEQRPAEPLDRPGPEFEVLGAEPVPRSAVPTVRFRMRATDASPFRVQTIALVTLISIEPAKRSYEAADRERLVELFGPPERWAATTDSFRWTQADVLVPGFDESVEFELPIPCSYDLELAPAKYLAGLAGGEVPLRFHFNGSVFYGDAEGRAQVIPLPWDRSIRFAMPHSVWSDTIAEHYPLRSWIPLDALTVERLAARKARLGAPTFDAAVSGLLDDAEGVE